jgi:hypothetical protein
VFASASSSSSSSAGISGFSRRPLSRAIPENRPFRYARQPFLSFPARECARSSFTSSKTDSGKCFVRWYAFCQFL